MASIKKLVLLLIVFGGCSVVANFYLYKKKVELQKRASALDANVAADQVQLLSLRRSLKSAKLRDELANMFIEVKHGNVGKAREQATQFFDDLRRSASEATDSQVRERLQSILDRRDEITADLVAMNASTVDKLTQMYLDLPPDSAVPF